MGPVVDAPLLVKLGPVGPDEAIVGPVVDGPLVVTPVAVGPGVEVFIASVNPVSVEPADVTERPVDCVAADDEDVVLPSAHAVTDNVTAVGPLLSVV